jgi:nucleoside-diphosphate-sugar epimerase
MTKARILITGARGFIGRQVIAGLAKDAELHGVSRHAHEDRSLIWHEADLTDGDACERLIHDVRPSVLVHCAWETKHGHFWHADSNHAWREAGKSLFTAFKATGGQRIVALGTCAEYGTSDAALKEADDTNAPETLYGQAKLDLLQCLRGLTVSFAWVRVFNAYGPHEDPRRFVPNVCNALLSGAPAACSSGRQIRDFIDVRDLGRAVATLTTSPLTDAINIGFGQPVSIAEIATRLGAIAGRPDLIALGQLPDRPGEAPLLIPDLSRQTRELRFQPTISLNEGLHDAFQWWKPGAEAAVGTQGMR